MILYFVVLYFMWGSKEFYALYLPWTTGVGTEDSLVESAFFILNPNLEMKLFIPWSDEYSETIHFNQPYPWTFTEGDNV